MSFALLLTALLGLFQGHASASETMGGRPMDSGTVTGHTMDSGTVTGHPTGT